MAECLICGTEATRYFGNGESTPLCDNPVCYQCLFDEINLTLDLVGNDPVSKEALDESF